MKAVRGVPELLEEPGAEVPPPTWLQMLQTVAEAWQLLHKADGSGQLREALFAENALLRGSGSSSLIFLNGSFSEDLSELLTGASVLGAQP